MSVKISTWDPTKTAEILVIRFNWQAARAQVLQKHPDWAEKEQQGQKGGLTQDEKKLYSEAREQIPDIVSLDEISKDIGTIIDGGFLFDVETSLDERVAQASLLIPNVIDKIKNGATANAVKKARLENLQLTSPRPRPLLSESLADIAWSALSNLVLYEP